MIVLITGASGGLGSAVVPAFLASGADAVFGVARLWDQVPLVNDRFHPMRADLDNASACDELLQKTGPVDVVVHLVGAFGGGHPVEGTTEDEWTRLMDVNLNSAFWLFRATLPGMKAAGHGRVIAIGSKAAVEPMPKFSAYSVAKAALVALVKAVAAEGKDSGITANIVLPGTIDTPANRQAMPKADHSGWVKPEAIAQTLVWLASDESAEVNGAVIPMFGRA